MWLGVAIALTGAAQAAPAQTYPVKPVRIVVPFPAGGSMDALARLLGGQLSQTWGQTVLIENRPGAASITGTRHVAESAPDGYTLVMIANGFTVNPSLYPQIPFKADRDFKPITQLTFTPNVLVANPAAGVRAVADLVAQSKKRATPFTSGSIGNGTASHLALERFKLEAGVDILHVPFQGLAPGVTAVLGGHTDMMMANLPDVLQHIRSGRLVGLAVGSQARHSQAPTIPTFVEQGFPSLVTGAWYGVAAPAGTPEAVLDKLHADFTSVLRQKAVGQRLETMGLDPVGSSRQAFEALIKDEIAANAELVRRAAIRAD